MCQTQGEILFAELILNLRGGGRFHLKVKVFQDFNAVYFLPLKFSLTPPRPRTLEGFQMSYTCLSCIEIFETTLR